MSSIIALQDCKLSATKATENLYTYYRKNSIFAIKPPLPLEMKKPLYRDKANNQKKHQLQTDR
jgi:hypothetical protein